MKRIFTLSLTMIFVLLLLSSCGQNQNGGTDTSGTEQISSDASDNTSDTSDTSGGGGGDMTDETKSEAEVYIDRLYAELGDDILPFGMATKKVDITNADDLSYNTGLTDTSGIEDVSVSESMVGSFAYSLVIITAEDEASAATIKANMFENINPRKWICVAAEKVACVDIENKVLLVMGSEQQVDAVMGALEIITGTDEVTMGETLEKAGE